MDVPGQVAVVRGRDMALCSVERLRCHLATLNHKHSRKPCQDYQGSCACACQSAFLLSGNASSPSCSSCPGAGALKPKALPDRWPTVGYFFESFAYLR